MDEAADAGRAFVEMAHRVVWATVATVDAKGRPRSRILHPLWERDGPTLTGLIATSPTPAKVAHLRHSPYVSVTYWSPEHDTCTAECTAAWVADGDERADIWERFKAAPAPVGYDPAIVPAWKEGGPRSDAFGVLRLEPWRLRVFPGSVLLGQGGTVLTWTAPERQRLSSPVPTITLSPATSTRAGSSGPPNAVA